MFEVGELVECVDDKFTTHRLLPGVSLPVRGGVYTVREVELNGIYLREITNPNYHFFQGFCEPGFLASRFRPFRSKHIELFRKIAENPKAPIKETA